MNSFIWTHLSLYHFLKWQFSCPRSPFFFCWAKVLWYKNFRNQQWKIVGVGLTFHSFVGATFSSFFFWNCSLSLNRCKLLVLEVIRPVPQKCTTGTDGLGHSSILAGLLDASSRNNLGSTFSLKFMVRPFKIECVFCIRKFWKLNARARKHNTNPRNLHEPLWSKVTWFQWNR